MIERGRARVCGRLDMHAVVFEQLKQCCRVLQMSTVAAYELF